MKKLIFCCLVVLMGSCKDKEKEVEPEVDLAPEFVGNYITTTVDGNTTVHHEWAVTSDTKNKLAIAYIKNVEVSTSGTTLTLKQEYALANVVPTAEATFKIDEVVDVVQSTGTPLKQKVEGIATKVINSAGVQQLNITLKLTNSSTNVATEDYLEFKKK
ncbi:hypothetical protein [Dyadobacter bucti]|uniref:hypothetical protein n=1 Tax=Dyadobacter bucti TaxID=2572203 RepID=UPI00110A0128|nr:hypothetical protein [Dyadobacter bucti]